MEKRIYRKDAGIHGTLEARTNGTDGRQEADSQPKRLPPRVIWHPGVFYPQISSQELTVWRHWLPTKVTIRRPGSWVPDDLVNLLESHQAPEEVMEECRWSCAMELFESYEVRTPGRSDVLGLLVIGRYGRKRYRVALWGESLRPFEEVNRLVAESLVIRKRAARCQHLLIGGGMLLGLACGLWVGGQPSYEGSRIGAGFALTFFGLLCTGVPSFSYAPVRRQQDYLDRYR